MSSLLRKSFRTKALSLFLHKHVGNSFESHHTLASSSWFWCRQSSHSLPQKPTPCFASNSTPSSSFSNALLQIRFWVSDAAASEPSTSDGLTVQQILANNWNILDENEGDWKSHATAIAQSINLIKRRLQWEKLKVRLDMLSFQLGKEDLWDDPVRAGKISREHGSLLGKMKEVNALEQELLEHIDMIKLAREENDADLESVGTRFILS